MKDIKEKEGEAPRMISENGSQKRPLRKGTKNSGSQPVGQDLDPFTGVLLRLSENRDIYIMIHKCSKFTVIK